MTIKDCIDATIKKHPNFTCALILEAYFMTSDRARAAAPNPNLGNNPYAFSSIVIDGENVRNHVRNKSNVIKEMEEECHVKLNNNFNTFIDLYINWYNNNKQNKDVIASEITSFDSYIFTVNDWLSKYGKNEVKRLLIQNSTNPEISKFIEEGSDYVTRRGGIDLTLDKYDKFMMFANHNNNYYELYVQEKHDDELQNYKKSVDYILNLNLNDIQKANIIYDIYQENYNPMLGNLPVDIEKNQILYTLLRNTLRSGIICANINGISNDEASIFSGLYGYQQVEEIGKLKKFVINKLCTNDIQNERLTGQNNIIEKIRNLTPDDIMYMSKLYIQTQKAGKDVIEDVKKYAINKNSIDKPYFDKVVYVLKMIEDKRFRLDLSRKQYN